jgi:hypothetical protein
MVFYNIAILPNLAIQLPFPQVSAARTANDSDIPDADGRRKTKKSSVTTVHRWKN